MLFSVLFQEDKSKQVIKRYLENIGNISKIKDVVVKAKVNQNGYIYDEIVYYKAPNKILIVNVKNGKEIQKTLILDNNVVAVLTDKNEKKDIRNLDKINAKTAFIKSWIFPEALIDKYGIKTKFIQKMTDTKTNYTTEEIEFRHNNYVWSNYYEIKTGLKIASLAYHTPFDGLDTPPQKILVRFLKFENIDDINFVTKAKILVDNKEISTQDYYSIQVNKGISDKIFNLDIVP